MPGISSADPAIEAASARPRVPRPSRATWLWLGLGTLAVLAITSPVYLTKRSFGPDWTNALWLTWHQGIAIRDSGVPSLYLLADQRGLFEPFFAFYGGTLYGTIGAVSALLGNRPEVAFVGANIVAVGGAYGGMVWLGREIGASRLARHVGGIVFISSPYYLTDLYARGAFAEFVALSAIPLALASGLALLRRPWTARSVLGFALALVVLSGSHNLTLVWGATWLAIIGVLALIALPRGDRPQLLRLLALGALAAVAVGVNSWAFVINVLDSSKVLIGSGPGATAWEALRGFNAPKVVFDPFRQQVPGSGTPGLSVAAPVWAMLWAAVVAWRGYDRIAQAPRGLRRMAVVLVIGLILVFLTILLPAPWPHMPKPLNLIQFPYRLNGYVAVLVAALVPITARLLASGPDAEPEEAAPAGLPTVAGPPVALRDRRWVAHSLVVLALISLIPGVLQAWNRQNDSHGLGMRPNREAVFAKGPNVVPVPSWYDTGSYHDASAKLVTVPEGRHVDIPLPDPGSTRAEATLELPAGAAPISTNIAGGPYVVDVSGVEVLGRDGAGFMVVQREGRGGGPVTIVVKAKAGTLQVVRWGLTVVCFLAIVGLATFLALRDRRRRRKDAGAPAPAPAAEPQPAV
jgi:hypothetical protein